MKTIIVRLILIVAMTTVILGCTITDMYGIKHIDWEATAELGVGYLAYKAIRGKPIVKFVGAAAAANAYAGFNHHRDRTVHRYRRYNSYEFRETRRHKHKHKIVHEDDYGESHYHTLTHTH